MVQKSEAMEKDKIPTPPVCKQGEYAVWNGEKWVVKTVTPPAKPQRDFSRLEEALKQLKETDEK